MRYVKFIYLFFLVVLFLPLVQQVYPFADGGYLNGYFVKEKKPQFSWANFDSLTYQDSAEKYLNQHFGFRNYCYRFRNQFYYSVFNQSPNENFYKGSDGYLYERVYIESYFGNDYVGKRHLHALTTDIKRLQDTLAKHGKLLLTIVAPSKAYFDPEYISPALDLTPGNPHTNYEEFCGYAKKQGLNFIDFNAWFLQLKGKTEHLLYYPEGTHWSMYGASMAFDSMYTVMKKLSGRNLPDLTINGYEEHTDLNIDDHDVANSFNLLYYGTPLPSYFPQFNVRKEGKEIPRVVGITDSYYGVLTKTGLLNACFQSPDYWFGYHEFMPHEKYDTIPRDDQFLRKEIENHDIFILMVTPHNIPRMGWDFTEQALKLFDPQNTAPPAYSYSYFRRFPDQENYILHNNEWLGGMLKQAKKENRNQDTLLYINVHYTIDGDDWKQKEE